MKKRRSKKGKSAKFERCVRAVKKSRSAVNPWAVCHAAQGKKGRRDPGRLRVERGPVGDAAWHLPDSRFIIYWAGPGARLRFGTREHLMFIDHPSADDSYGTFKKANAAVQAFLRAGSTSSRDPGQKTYDVWVFQNAASFFVTKIKAPSAKEAKAIAWRQYPRSHTISVATKSRRDPRGALVNRPRRDLPRGRRRTFGGYVFMIQDAHGRFVVMRGRQVRSATHFKSFAHEKDAVRYAERLADSFRAMPFFPDKPGSPRRRHVERSLPSKAEYESREIHSFLNDLARVEKAPLAERKEGAKEFAQAMAHDPELVAERVGWLLAGNYGYGSYVKAREVARSPRMNRVAWLTQTIGSLEWHSPWVMTRAAWKKMPREAQKRLNDAVSREIEGHLKDEG